MTFLRTLLAPLLLGAFATLAVPAQADELSLDQISRYVESLTKAKASFTQVNADGSTATGTLYLWRPFRARFEYDPPAEALVVIGGLRVAIFDGKSNLGPEEYPLRKTPLRLLLEPKVDLAGSGMVLDHGYDGTATWVLVHDPKRPEIGTMKLYFTDPPALRQWVITDQVGDQTTVVLGPFEPAPELGNSLFSIEGEQRRLGR